MLTHEAANLAVSLMDQHGLYVTGWHFEWDTRSTKRFGVCDYSERVIKLSEKLVRLNDEAQVRDTILHEIAHALVGQGHGHGHVWQRQAVAIGAKPERCYSATETQMPETKYVASCPNCKASRGFTRLGRSTITGQRKMACGPCCKRYAFGRYDDRFKLEIRRRW